MVRNDLKAYINIKATQAKSKELSHIIHHIAYHTLQPTPLGDSGADTAHSRQTVDAVANRQDNTNKCHTASGLYGAFSMSTV
jgi:hypothetical protein